MKKNLILLLMLVFNNLNIIAQSQIVYFKTDSKKVYYKVVKDGKESYYRKSLSRGKVSANYKTFSTKISEEIYNAISSEEKFLTDQQQFANEKIQTETIHKSNLKKGYRGFLNPEYILGVGDFKDFNRIGVQTSHGYQFNNYFFLGAGAGFEYNSDAESRIVPVFGDLRFTLASKVTPFLDLKVGYSCNDCKGFYFNPSLGVRFPLGKVIGLNVGVGYELIKYNESGSITTKYYGATGLNGKTVHYNTTYYDNDFTVHSVQFKIGIDF